MAEEFPNLEEPNAATEPSATARFAPITAESSDEPSPSEDDESSDNDDLGAEDAQSVLGVSISHAQSHFTNPNTPAAEKAAMLEQIDGGGLFDGSSTSRTADIPSDQTGPVSRQSSIVKHNQSSATRLPSPWRAGSRPIPRAEETRSFFRDGFGYHRRRASWGSNAQETIRRMLPSFNLPSLPKSASFNFSFPSLPYAHSFDVRSPNVVGRRKANTVSSPQTAVPILRNEGRTNSLAQLSLSTAGSVASPPGAVAAAAAASTANIVSTAPPSNPLTQVSPSSTSASGIKISLEAARRPSYARTVTQRSTLRRSASDDSLLIYRGLSRASSLGDDSRFEHVQEQVNSRFKAIKDSFQDSNFRMPTMPSIPNLGFGSRFDSQTIRTPSFLRDFQPLDGFRSSISRRSTITKPPDSSQVSRSLPHARNDSTGATSTHPYFNQALEELTGDLVVMGGYRGSILRSAEFPHRQLWVPLKVGLNLRRVDLEVGLEPEDDEKMYKTIIPGGMLTHIGPVDIGRRLLKRLRNSANVRKGTLRIHEYSYDWRLNPNLLSQRLQTFLEGLPCNQAGVTGKDRGATVIAHSLGGLITRHAINHRPELFAGVVYAGTPQHCVNILGPFRNGDDVLLSSKVLTAQVNFTIRTSFALLPLEGKCFLDKNTKEEYPIDFFDPQTWVDYCLSPCVATALPSLSGPISGGIGGLIGSVTSSLSIMGRKGSVSQNNVSRAFAPADIDSTSRDAGGYKSQPASAQAAEASAEDRGVVPQIPGGQNGFLSPPAADPATACTIPRDAAMKYLTRVLTEVKDFKLNLTVRAAHSEQNHYPPAAVIYGKSVPTVSGARVVGKDGIRHADAYDDLSFASGDGVVLARAAMIPDGYQAVRGGVVSSDRGHIGLLGDLEAVGRCLTAIIAARKKGVGLGTSSKH